MNKEQVEIVVGGLLHDIGKVLYRGYDGRNHSQSGYDFLKNEVAIDSKSILEQVHFHHKKLLSQSNINNKSAAYITYIADNIAAAADRRQKDDGEKVFQKDIPLSSVFNILNGNKQDQHYEPKTLDISDGINFPTNNEVKFS